MSRTNNIHEVSETMATFSRVLENGQTLDYQLEVLQQPERARACGQGAKSHADRRPVDPPPVVELRLLQGTGKQKQDVTFSHHSNFFLFATLEHARPQAQARGMPTPAPQPVLTGVPVSGMAYLDRPAPAGYFIFPDLSVRHEGRYRLRFALYEQTQSEGQYATPMDPLEPREFCTHRLDVKSKAFTVFSAKKFPGLAESTQLSRIVAEQGCRVRIRRDVRMRRRNDRPRGRDSDEEMDETAMLRAQRAHSPDHYDIDDKPQQPQPAPQYHQAPAPSPYPVDNRKRSGSNAASTSPAEVKPSRYMPPTQTHAGYGHSMPPQQHPSANHHLSFGGNNSHASPHPAPPAPSPHYSAQPSHDLYRGGYMGEPQARPPTQYQGPPAPYHSARENTSPTHNQQMNGRRRDSPVEDYRQRREPESAYHAPQYRPTTPSVQQPPQQYHGPAQNSYGPQQQYPAPPHHQPMAYHPPQQQQAQPFSPLPSLGGLRLPPIAPAAPAPPAGPVEPHPWQQTTPTTSAPPQSQQYPPANPVSRAGPPPMTISPPQVSPPNPTQFPAYYPESSKYGPSSSSQGPGAAPIKAAEPATKKREWGRVFNTAHTEGPLRNGVRPDSESDLYGSDAFLPSASDVDDDGYEDFGKLKMTYRRADGVEIVRKLTDE